MVLVYGAKDHRHQKSQYPSNQGIEFTLGMGARNSNCKGDATRNQDHLNSDAMDIFQTEVKSKNRNVDEIDEPKLPKHERGEHIAFSILLSCVASLDFPTGNDICLNPESVMISRQHIPKQRISFVSPGSCQLHLIFFVLLVNSGFLGASI